MTELEKVLLGILEAIGVPLILKLIAGTTPRDTAVAILEAEYATAEAAAEELRRQKFGP